LENSSFFQYTLTLHTVSTEYQVGNFWPTRLSLTWDKIFCNYWFAQTLKR